MFRVSKVFICVITFTLSATLSHALNYSTVGARPNSAVLTEVSQLIVSLSVEMRQTANQTTTIKQGRGTGFVVSTDPKKHTALIMTAAHCVSCQGHVCKIWVKGFFGEKFVERKSIKMDLAKDIAIFKVKIPKKFKLALQTPFGPASALAAGDRALWYGYPDLSLRAEERWVMPRPLDYKTYGLRFADGKTISYISDFSLYSTALKKVSPQKIIALQGDLLQGNSGGPVFNEQGEVIGIMIQSYYGDIENKDQHPYCAGLRPDCFQIAISSEAIAEFMEKTFPAGSTH